MQTSPAAQPPSLLALRRLQRHFVVLLLAVLTPALLALWWYQHYAESVEESRLLASAESHVLQQQLAFEQVLQVATNHLQRLALQMGDSMSRPELGLDPGAWQSLEKYGARRLGSGALIDAQLDPWWQARFGQLFVAPRALKQPDLEREIRASMALFPAMYAAHQAHPYFQWSYFYSPREDFSSIYPFVAERDILQATGTQDIDAMLKVIFDAGGTTPVQMMSPNRNPQRESRWTAPYYDAGGKGAMVSLLRPLYLQDQFAGVLGTDVTLRMFAEVLHKEGGELGHALVLNSLGHVLADDAGQVLESKDILKADQVLPAAMLQLPLSQLLKDKSSLQSNGQWRWRVLPLRGSQWYLLVYFSELELAQAKARQVINTPLILLGLLAVLLMAIWAISYLFAVPALRLVDFLNHLQGNPQSALPSVPKVWQSSFSQVAATAKERADYLAELEGHSESLEQTVNLRTRELLQANDVLRQTIEQLKATQKMLVESEKMAALGSLVAGVAHELNTPIGVSVTMGSTLQEKNRELAQEITAQTLRKAALADYVEVAEQGLQILMRNLEQAAQLVSSFKQVAVDQTSDQRRQFDLAQLVQQVMQTMGVLYGNDRLQARLPEGLVLDSFPGALVQVLNNLISNAEIHAFDGVADGQVMIEADVLDGERVRLRVRDNGVGIKPEHLSHIFEPFFTTKLGHGGSGLGLNIVYNIVHSVLGGEIEAQSVPGQGASFTLILPLRAPESLPAE
ncbi:ATP-binding protein [Chitinibacter sp. GC72]|uniref:ATP-binding protein n=1 Tax=Chitinibacter sp. GC72 TaxID=1526917 RepID=UPI0012F9C1B0|nr:ATP-binding protein [Chitinibacter sp. GC72]